MTGRISAGEYLACHRDRAIFPAVDGATVCASTRTANLEQCSRRRPLHQFGGGAAWQSFCTLSRFEPDIWRRCQKPPLYWRLEQAVFHLPQLPWCADAVNAVQRLSRIAMICSEPDRLADFYESTFGFERTGEASITEPAFAALMGIPGATARVASLRLCEHE